MADIQVENGGSIYLLRPLTDRGRQWLRENVQAESWQWFGDGLAVEHRYVADVVEGARAEGMEVI